MISGRCLCGKIGIELGVETLDVNHCHCSLCRRMTGSAFGTWAKFPMDALSVVAGATNLRHVEATPSLHTRFCGGCGSTLYATHSDYPGFVYVAAGILADDAGLQPRYHEWVGSKAPWFEIRDDLPQFTEWRDDD